MKFQLLIKTKRKINLALKFSDVFILLINVKMPTIVGILTFMRRISCSDELSMIKFLSLGRGCCIARFTGFHSYFNSSF